ncbi:polyprenyltransferase [Chitinophaga costaii]|nr:polyprenyltransferase [Chitinophaga costaii]
MRPANLLTAVADILAGIAVAGYFSTAFITYLDILPLACLCLATIGLYGGGVVFNDVMDARLDQIERPERPIPSGVISRSQAIIQGAYLLLVGILAAFTVSTVSGLLGISIAAAALIYNKWGKHLDFWGPLNMGLCRGLNLLLGISIIPGVLLNFWWLGLIPVLYIAAITMISRGEVHGGNVSTLRVAVLLYTLVLSTILLISWRNGHLLVTLPFVALTAYIIYRPLIQAIRLPAGPNIGKAVQGGILALIVINAAWAAAFSDWTYALIILALLPISMLLAKAFAVT